MTQHSWGDSHIKHSRKSMAHALFIASGTFLVMFLTFHVGGALYVASLSEKISRAFEQGIQDDLAHLEEQGDRVAENALLKEYILTENSEKLITVLQEEREARDIGLMGVANAEGVVIGRTKSPGKRGDNAFVTSPVGHLVAEGKSAESVEAPIGFDPRQIFLTTGRPVVDDGVMIGALFANYLTDDTYAKRFKEQYLPQGAEVVFYNNQGGLYGISFTDPEVHKVLNSYFNSGSRWVKSGRSDETVSFSDDRFYYVENFIFPGLEGSPGGALLFIPRHDISDITRNLLTIVALCVFLFFALQKHIRTRNEERGWRYYVLLILVAIGLVAVSVFSLRLQNIGYLKLEKIPYTLYNSTIRIQPEFGVYDLAFEQRFSIVVDTGDEPVNAVSASLQFDPDAIKIVVLDTANSACTYIVENVVDTQSGTATISCVILKPTEEQSSLTIAEIVAVPEKTGNFTLSFDVEKTHVLANDGLGTDVLRTTQSGSYRVESFQESVVAEPFIIFSPTHQNQSRWYSAPIARFVWKRTPGTVYAYTFDTTPNTFPKDTKTTQKPNVEIPIPGDGVYYAHVRQLPDGPTAHYRVQSDKTPPTIISMELSSEKIVAGDVVRFSFKAEDSTSGVQKNYYVDLGNRLFLPIGSELFIPFLEPGKHRVVLRVYDAAGNYSEQSKEVSVFKSLPVAK